MSTNNTLIVARAPSPPLISVLPDERHEADGITVDQLCAQFLESKRMMIEAGELGQLTFDGHYVLACARVQAFFGPHRPIESITPMMFSKLRASLPAAWGPSTTGRAIQAIRTLFKFAYDVGLLEKPIRFGPDFRRPAARLYRLARQAKELQMFEAAEIRAMLDAATPTLRAMIVLAINTGFGNSDCGRLLFSHLDLDKARVNFPRPKTGIPRVCPLWPETVAAIRRAILLRPTPSRPECEQLVFLTSEGNHWCDGEGASSLGLKFSRLVKRLGLHRDGCKFYGLRRTFETIGGDSLDQVAVDAIMGHAPHSSDMGAVYRQRVADDRLIAVTECVRAWLFPDQNKNHFQQYKAKAAAIHVNWEKLAKISAADIQQMLTLLGIKQFELARGIGYNAIWVNALVRGRSPLSPATEMRIRAFVQQLAQGELPTPAAKEELKPPQFKTPADIPLTDGARAALLHNPLTASDLLVLAECLSQFGITQVQLSAWWGYNYKFYRKMRYCEKAIPPQGAARLRAIFGLAPYPSVDNPRSSLDMVGEFRTTPRIVELFAAEQFGAAHVREITDYLRSVYGVTFLALEDWLGLTRGSVWKMRNGQLKMKVDTRSALRAAFTFEAEQTGGAI